MDSVLDHPKDLVTFTAEHFHLSRQAIHKHVQALVEEKILEGPDSTRGSYALAVLAKRTKHYETADLEEHKVWYDDFLPLLRDLPENARGLLQYGLSEMVNNAIDHSASATATVVMRRTAREIQLAVADEGVGIFAKIKAAFSLDDERHAMLELSKGKLTTDPKNHTGQGIFFTSRMVERFVIKSGLFVFIHDEDSDVLFDVGDTPQPGTFVTMCLRLPTKRTVESVFNAYSAEHDDYGFSRTTLFVKLAQYEGERLVSRSQAKRLLARMERFREVMLDFSGVETIGQAFADEIFRVFPSTHAGVSVTYRDATDAVRRMIQHVTADLREREVADLIAQAESLALQLRHTDDGPALMGKKTTRASPEARTILSNAQQAYDEDPALFQRMTPHM